MKVLTVKLLRTFQGTVYNYLYTKYILKPTSSFVKIIHLQSLNKGLNGSIMSQTVLFSEVLLLLAIVGVTVTMKVIDE